MRRNTAPAEDHHQHLLDCTTTATPYTATPTEGGGEGGRAKEAIQILLWMTIKLYLLRGHLGFHEPILMESNYMIMQQLDAVL